MNHELFSLNYQQLRKNHHINWRRLKRRLILLFCFWLGILITLAGVAEALPVVLHPPTTPVPSSFFGMHIHRTTIIPTYRIQPPVTHLTSWPQVPFGTWRLWDAYVSWRHLEPEKGQWRFDALDRSLELAENHSIDVLLPLAHSPTWASARPTERSAYAPRFGFAAEPARIEDWRNYVRTVATRYKGRIRYYEIWNEPNWQPQFSGSVDAMVTLAREAYQVLKEVDPCIVVVSPAATDGDAGVTWLDEYLSKGGGDYADVIGYHFYVTPARPEVMVQLIAKVKEIMEKHGVENKPLWNTETGWSQPKPFTSDTLGAAYVARSYILNWAAGVSRFYWYAWDNHHWVSLKMTEPDYETPTAAAIAYDQVQQWLVGARMTQCESNWQKTWICELQRNDHDHAWILWNPDQPMDFNVPERWGVRQVRALSGERREFVGHSLTIGLSPLLLETRSP